jgi:hypothetical protein
VTSGSNEAGASFVPTALTGDKAAQLAAQLSVAASAPSSVAMLKAMGAPNSVLAKFADFDGTATNDSASLGHPG